MRGRTSTLVAAAAALGMALAPVLAGCGKKATEPVAPPTSLLPPEVVATYPPARSALVRYDTPCLWVAFAAPLDSATVTDHYVFLKIDDVRVPVSVRWRADSNRVVVTPQQPLKLATTYTVELSPDLRTANGVALGATYWWQFTTNSLFLPGGPGPVDGAAGQSPFVALSWRSDVLATPGGVGYDVYAGADSAAVAARAVPRVTSVVGSLTVRPTPWPLASRTWWALTAFNLTTGERLDGPVWRFDTVDPAAARLDSVSIYATMWGWASLVYRTRVGCSSADFISGYGYKCGVLWAYNASQAPVFAGARVTLWTTASYADSVPTDLPLLACTSDFATNCSFSYDGVPYVDEGRGALAWAVFPAPRQIVLESDALSAYVAEVMARGLRRGFFLRTPREVHYVSGSSIDPSVRPTLVLRYYVPNP